MNNNIGLNKYKKLVKANLYIGLGKSLLIWFLAISFIPLVIISFINYLSTYIGLTTIAENSLYTNSQLRVEYLESYFENTVNFVEIQSEDKSNIDFFSSLETNFQNSKLSLNKYVNTNKWDKLTNKKRSYFQNILSKNEYHNLYFIDINGNILFKTKKENDLGSNIFNTENLQTLLAKSCKKAIDTDKTIFSDLCFHQSSDLLPSGFIIKTMINENGEKFGLFILQINIDKINHIIQNNLEFGETGETYIVGKDLLFRSATRFDDNSIILTKKVTNDKALNWQKLAKNKNNKQYIKNSELDIEKVTIYLNNKGKNVLGIYRDLSFLDKLGVQWALIEEVEHDEAYAYAKKLSDIAKIFFIVTIIIVFFIAILVTRKFVNPIKKISAWAKEVAQGKLIKKTIDAPKNEVGEIVSSFNNLVDSLHSYAAVSESAALGDYPKSIKIRSEDDILGKSMSTMINSFKEVVHQSNQIAKGDYSTNITPRCKNDTLGISLFEMTKTLRETSEEIKNQDWLKTGLNELETNLSGLKDINKLTAEVITFLVKYLNSQIGLIYLSKENEILELSSDYALKNKKGHLKYKFGEGLIGQAAKEKEKILFVDNNDELPDLDIGIGNKTLKNYIITPLIFENTVIGVILIGSVNNYSELQQSFIDICTERIAIAINTVQSHSHVELLLEQTQEQADELTVQQEELRQANEELEEQTKALKTSEENLKNQQEELRVINEELEERTNDLEIQRDNINKKNLELEKAQIEINQKANDLEQASRYKSEFLANMSHELRTPLNSILVLSQLLASNKKEHLNEKEIEYAKTINTSGSDLLDLINEILDLSKVESGKIELYIEKVYYNDIKDSVTRTFKPFADEKGIDLEINISENLNEYIRTDFQRMYQIIKNLLSNGIKFTKKGSVKLNISRANKKTKFTSSKLKAEETIAFSVVDTGIGIPKEKQLAVFNAFQQADGTTSRKYGGTGLGLTISKNFAKLLGGELHLESAEGKGTIFTLFIPETIEKNKIDETTAPSITESIKVEKLNYDKKVESKIITKTNQFQPLIPLEKIDDRDRIESGDDFILIIEDDLNFCQILVDLAHEKGFMCMIALDGETGLHYSDYYIPSAIILDLGLPGIDGYEVMNRLKKNINTRHIPVHIISASDKSLKAMKMGAIGFLQKPVNESKLNDVFKKIENIISKPIKKILIVEDEELMRKSIVNLLGDGNVLITAVESGEEAYDLLKKNKYECMVLDLGLKELSGFELLEKVRKHKKSKDLPVIIYTGKELSKEDDEKLQKYADSIILKGARSFERLLQETTLFLHQVESDMPIDKQKLLNIFHQDESVLVNKKILIVDDDMRNVFALSSVLEERKMTVIVGKNGKEGIDRLKTTPDIDLILMDIMMPEMDGYEAISIIRKFDKFKDIPIIALTAKAMKGDREKCIAAGANEYLSKPIIEEKLISLLRVWLYK